ncbi:MAG: hypothetical protein ACXV8Q_06685 [Methylobacter sp.]
MHAAYPKRWGRLKKYFTQSWLTLGGAEQSGSLAARYPAMLLCKNIRYAMKETTSGILTASITIR